MWNEKRDRAFHDFLEFISDPSRKSLKRASDWKIWSEKADDLIVKLAKFSEDCKELDKSLQSCTNWDDLPVEMKEMCIGWMDFTTRTSLRRTRRHERMLVDSKKQKLTRLTVSVYNFFNFSFYRYHRSVHRDSSRISTGPYKSRSPEDALESLTFLLKHVDFEEYHFEASYTNPEVKKNVELLLAELKKSVPFRFPKLFFHVSPDYRLPLFVLKNCETDIESVEFRLENRKEEHLFIDLPQIERAKCVSSTQYGFIFKILEKWFSTDPPIGAQALTKAGFHLIVKRFEPRILSQTDKHIRLPTGNQEKHIIIQHYRSQGSMNTMQCTVVSADYQVE